MHPGDAAVGLPPPGGVGEEGAKPSAVVSEEPLSVLPPRKPRPPADANKVIKRPVLVEIIQPAPAPRLPCPGQGNREPEASNSAIRPDPCRLRAHRGRLAPVARGLPGRLDHRRSPVTDAMPTQPCRSTCLYLSIDRVSVADGKVKQRAGCCINDPSQPAACGIKAVPTAPQVPRMNPTAVRLVRTARAKRVRGTHRRCGPRRHLGDSREALSCLVAELSR
jgi:hypothetical protein